MNPDTMSAVAVALAFTAVLLASIALDRRERRKLADRMTEAVLELGPAIIDMTLAGECAHIWYQDGEGFHLCVRHYQHTGPHVCGICPDGAAEVER